MRKTTLAIFLIISLFLFSCSNQMEQTLLDTTTFNTEKNILKSTIRSEMNTESFQTSTSNLIRPKNPSIGKNGNLLISQRDVIEIAESNDLRLYRELSAYFGDLIVTTYPISAGIKIVFLATCMKILKLFPLLLKILEIIIYDKTSRKLYG